MKDLKITKGEKEYLSIMDKKAFIENWTLALPFSTRDKMEKDIDLVIKGETSELLKQRDELKEALAEQKRLYFSLFDEETSCMYCEAKIRRGSAIILCKECAENTEV